MTYSPRLATTPAGALTNYIYALAEFECRVGLIAMGLDPGIGWAHKDAPYRDSAALDVLEPLRPVADEWVLRLLRTRTFSKREFLELPNGQVRLAPSLARLVADSALPTLERAVGPVVEDVARVLAASAPSALSVRTRLTQADRKRGRARARGIDPRKTPSACRMCGVVLADSERAYCDDCLPLYDAERSAKLSGAGKKVLAAMRASPNDPAKAPEAKAKHAAAVSRNAREIAAWEREHGSASDSKRYEQEILPLIRLMTVPQLVSRTGLSKYFCWQVRRGERRLHPRHWDRLRRVGD